MAGTDNLIPTSKRSKAEARELGRKGGIASGKTRRRQSNIRKTMKALLQEDCPAKFNGQDCTYEEAICYAMIMAVIKKKSPNAFGMILKAIGEEGLCDVTLQEKKAQTKFIEARTESITGGEDNSTEAKVARLMELIEGEL